ncbi:hypothetical protein AVEN_56187-1 [Araneus ventricosus]|uniref:Tc1-like transposase DDE domain-containing protein n=1 Tax=Araneus ventricosus TaxID=182803 RepID=A0A4Y2IWT6_ARAVE|nr:hypothetical protein AVEN_56187-1 [Araneus ventricosus]
MMHVFRLTECLKDKTFIPGRWEIRDMLSKFDIILRWSINAWCGIFNDRLIEPVFYEGTLKGQRYLELLQDVIIDFAENLPFHHLRNIWFQYDSAPPHKISNVKQYLMETFQSQVIGYGGFV